MTKLLSNRPGYCRILFLGLISFNSGVHSLQRGKLFSIYHTMTSLSASPTPVTYPDSFNSMLNIIDSHVHVWNDGAMPFAYSGIDAAPPLDLKSVASPSSLRTLMQKSGVQGAVIIQPINYKYDHSYLLSVMNDKEFSNLFKFVCLFNPTYETVLEGEQYLENLHSQGFVGALKMPVGIMCFKGLSLHFEDIEALLQHSPQTEVVIDHFGFYKQGGVADETAWQQLLSLARYPQVNVKVSALFRVSSLPWPHPDLGPRVLALVEAFGANRLLFGTDFPFVQQQIVHTPEGGVQTPGQNEAGEAAEPYVRYVRAPSMWPDAHSSSSSSSSSVGLSRAQWADVMGGTAERLYGRFGG